MILKNCAFLITQDQQRQVLEGYDLRISGGKISKIAKNIDSSGEAQIDCKKKIVLPSFINLHTHLAMGLLRGHEDDLELEPWLSSIWKAEEKMSQKEYYAGSKFACLEMIRSGTSAFLDMYFEEKNTLKAAKEAKLRGYFGEGLIDYCGSKKAGPIISKLTELTKYCQSQKSPLLNPIVTPHSCYTCSEELIVESKKFAAKNKLLYGMHLSETRKEVYGCYAKHKKRPAEYLESLGVLDSNFIGFHSSWLTKGEIETLAKYKSSAAHCPTSNMKLATGGAFPYREMKEAGVKIGLGTDGAASNNSLNILGEMKAACLMQKWLRWNASEMSAQQALDLATIGGASILKLNSGSLESGKNADILMLDKNHFSMLPPKNLVSHIVYSCSREAITDLIVNGEFLMNEGKVMSLKEEEVKQEFLEAFERLI
jgi:5-methylthioadenosine/S-adenosylhomocysteine deaminase